MKKQLVIAMILLLSKMTAQIFTPNGTLSATLDPSSWNIGINTNTPKEQVEIFGNVVFGAKKIAPQTTDTKWIFHTRGDGKNLFIAPRNINDQEWDWGRQTRFDGNGNVFFSGNVAVQGKLEAIEVKVTQSPTADFVFDEGYDLPSLEAVEKHIRQKKHLPEIASAKEMEQDGVNVGEFQIKLLQKIEELTLYSIEQNKQIKQQIEENKQQQEKIKNLESENLQFKTLLERVEKLEKKENAN